MIPDETGPAMGALENETTEAPVAELNNAVRAEEDGAAVPEADAEVKAAANGVETESEEDAEYSFDITEIFSQEAKSSELSAGIHEDVVLFSIDPERRKDNTGKLIKKQLYLKFKKYNKEGEDIGEKDISFFLIDAARDSAIRNLHSLLAQTKEILSLYYTEAELDVKFNPLGVLYDESENKTEEELNILFDYEGIKKNVLKKSSLFVKVENELCAQFYSLLEDKIGFESLKFRLRLEESKDAKYVQLPAFERFAESQEVTKEDSLLYNA